MSFDDAMHHEAMSFTNGEDRTVRVLLTPLNSGKASFKLVSAGTEDRRPGALTSTGTLRDRTCHPHQRFPPSRSWLVAGKHGRLPIYMIAWQTRA